MQRFLLLSVLYTFTFVGLSACTPTTGTEGTSYSIVNEKGELLLRYGQVKSELETVTQRSNPYRNISHSPLPPPADYTQVQQNSYWIGATNEAMRRCGFSREASALLSKAADRSAFNDGKARLPGNAVKSCGRAKRLADAILAHSD